MNNSLPRGEFSSVHSIFEWYAGHASDRIALSMGTNQVTYGQLDSWSAEIASRLKAAGVTHGSLVGLFMERSFELVAAIIGILRAGAGYVPIDPEYPADRIDFINRDSSATVVIAQPHLRNRLPSGITHVITIDPFTGHPAERRHAGPESSELRSPDALAYVMYTSGSTGTPKGVAIPHRGIIRLVRDADFFRVSPDDVFLLLAPISFDASTFELWGALLNGARLEIAPPGQTSLAQIGGIIKAAPVSIMWLTAGLFNVMVEERLPDLAPVRQLLCGGDVLSVTHIRRALAGLPGTQLINGYGPTENTTFTCCHQIPRDLPDGRSVPIGRAIHGTTIHIVDEQMREVSDGDEGELLTGGQGVALGYWKRPELTAEKFIRNPFAADGSLLYRTGDQVRRLPDGTVEFLGRKDAQVKLRGYRIELGEIETAIRLHPAVRDCAVKAWRDSFANLQLSAYVVKRDGQSLTESDLRQHVSQRLPDYMAPGGWMFLEQLPLNPNGKVDRAKLPETTSGTRPGKPLELPRNDTEKMLADAWEGVLGHPVDVAASFFDVGANSLLVTKVHERLRRERGLTLPLTEMFRFPSIRRLAEQLQKTAAPISPAETPTDRAPLRRAAFDRFKKRMA